jgi:putative phosphoribosyl transferase
MTKTEVVIPVENNIILKGNLNLPANAKALVIFSHGSGSGRFSLRNNFVADFLNVDGYATLLVDLLTLQEDEYYKNRFDIDLLSRRLVAITKYTADLPGLKGLPVGYFGASTGAASALNAAAKLNQTIKAVVSRGGRPDLAESKLLEVKAPTLLIVGSKDTDVIMLNEQAYELLYNEKRMEIVEGASHLFEEPGKLEEVAKLARDFFSLHLKLVPKRKAAIV